MSKFRRCRSTVGFATELRQANFVEVQVVEVPSLSKYSRGFISSKFDLDKTEILNKFSNF